MPSIEFHTDLAEPVDFACRLLRKAYRQNARVSVVAPQATLRALDNALWTFDPHDFVPHAQVTAATHGKEQVQRAPIWLMSEVNFDDTPDILVNLGAELLALAPTQAPGALDRFQRIIEVVSRDVDEAASARQRWRDYRQMGLTIKHHNASASP